MMMLDRSPIKMCGCVGMRCLTPDDTLVLVRHHYELLHEID